MILGKIICISVKLGKWIQNRTWPCLRPSPGSFWVGIAFCFEPIAVPQGSVLGPVLFLIFINDLPDNIRSSVRLFADDCVLYRNVKSPLDCQILQDDLNSLAKWEMDWQVKFIVSKCHSMRVTRLHPSRHIDFNYTLHQQTLEQVQSASLLVLFLERDQLSTNNLIYTK